jgi:hydroxymethylglutaryl-CoA reductase
MLNNPKPLLSTAYLKILNFYFKMGEAMGLRIISSMSMAMVNGIIASLPNLV